MDQSTSPWLLLIVSLPTNSATGRMRIWRALKALGCSALRDGAYLLPYTEPFQQQLAHLVDETVRESGNAWLLTVYAQSATENDAYRALFDRTSDYADFLVGLGELRTSLSSLKPQEINRVLRKARRDYETVHTMDYFPNNASTQAEAVWLDFVHLAETLISPGEPQAIDAAILQLDRAAYQGRTWATRSKLWVDRVASAWLIRRFIDQDARFLWLESAADCPKKALGFDFDGATFTHIGERVTFEVLLASFGLDRDRGLQRLGAMVHALDVGGRAVPEAVGFEAMMAGTRQRAIGDDQLLAEIGTVLDSLHAHFSNDQPTGEKA